MNKSQNKKNDLIQKERYCYFCVNNADHIDYKNQQLLRRFISSYSKIVPRKRSGVCSKHQRQLAQAIKRARIMAILPFVTK
ncbi:MAG: 30S ribosomal protein S18 [Candidatus Buchananbacteria bacterium RIFCSPHIGHO2_02_FULL_40_13]|uniref:Small ribosomal subunit protein bS18 n=1 Tax=Candidatus Buchananbacteria bacterium RIFCSPLOWO2_01_FULL_39_33 TaxID=1797543 RepID=A0A1G1YK46_9BACT|nr:MAG: 30S ribosomal protein S18 [Candidatus Buchananbacteria bacterium RIFCSPHIGHO2_01_FULL_40_35]OGY48987.1 MAG: 30S ribosomal protein S18 [Candidatus Buchananbacteria bacterium RIFCSPHIGHO2_02_FULL_40_13]OGY51837.1 MAG: 30S ribosomal protein S18 [Candidatus Buchananbacteria bacterium RIFCSPLOWO2_01_FULL_39_33]